MYGADVGAKAIQSSPPPKPFVIVTVTGLDVGTDVELTDSTTGGLMGTAA